MILPRYVSVHTLSERDTRKTNVRSEVEDDYMSITRSISIAQTDNRVLKANCYVDYCLY